MKRSSCCKQEGLKKGPWTPEEDQKLLANIREHGAGTWHSLPEKAGLKRCGKSCRLRWINYLRPDIKRGNFSLQEEETIIKLHALLGNRWSLMATLLPKRTDNEIKNHWNTHLKKRLMRMGIDPMTHKMKSPILDNEGGNYKNAVTLSHMAQWESIRLEAEARLVQRSKASPQSDQQPMNHLHLSPFPPLPFLEGSTVSQIVHCSYAEPLAYEMNFSGNVDPNPGIGFPENLAVSMVDEYEWRCLEASTQNELNSLIGVATQQVAPQILIPDEV